MAQIHECGLRCVSLEKVGVKKIMANFAKLTKV